MHHSLSCLPANRGRRLSRRSPWPAGWARRSRCRTGAPRANGGRPPSGSWNSAQLPGIRAAVGPRVQAEGAVERAGDVARHGVSGSTSPRKRGVARVTRSLVRPARVFSTCTPPSGAATLAPARSWTGSARAFAADPAYRPLPARPARPPSSTATASWPAHEHPPQAPAVVGAVAVIEPRRMSLEMPMLESRVAALAIVRRSVGMPVLSRSVCRCAGRIGPRGTARHQRGLCARSKLQSNTISGGWLLAARGLRFGNGDQRGEDGMEVLRRGMSKPSFVALGGT